MPSIALSIMMGICVYLIQFVGLSYILTLFLQVLSGAFIYIAGSKILKLEEFEYIYNYIKNKHNH